jgi:alanine racemase
MLGGIYPGADRAWLEVDLDAVRHNAAVLRRRAGAPLVPMVKADGYGTGAVAVARALGAPFASGTHAPPDGEAPWALGIATLDEAEALRQAGCTARLLCTSPLLGEALPRAAALGVRPSLHRVEDVVAWTTMGEAPWHLSIDTGMSRAGVRWDAVAWLRDLLGERLRAHPPEGVFTHFHSADEWPDTRVEQERRFRQALAELAGVLPAGVLRHAANSAGIALGEHAPGWDLARPGIGLYGAGPEAELGLAPVVHLRARVVDLRWVEPGETVSYGATWTAPARRRIATLGIGYGDGYRRHLSGRGTVLVRGTPCPVAGRVTMDMTMVDVTEVPCELGDVATLLGRDGGHCLTVNAVAETGGLSPYELLVGLRLRVPVRHRSADGG